MSKLSLILFLAATATPAFAYIDPNSGGLISQLLTPLLLVIGVAWAALRRKLSGMLLRGFRRPRTGGKDERKT